MTTIAVEKPAPGVPATVGTYDRLFYSGMAVLMALTAFAGFAPTYYLRLLGGSAVTVSGATVTPLLHLHAAVFTAWVLLFLVQTALVARRRVRLHRRLGVAGAALAAAMLVVGMGTALTGARAGVAPRASTPSSSSSSPSSTSSSSPRWPPPPSGGAATRSPTSA